MALSRRNSVTASLILPRHLSSSFTATSSSSIATPSSSAAISSFSSTDFEALLPTKPIPSYTSLKDLLPFTATLNSPTATTSSGSEIPIRNRLVKQAAWAYLQPMSTSPNSGSNNLFRRVGARVLSIPLFSLIQAAAKAIAKALCFCFR